MAGGGVEARRSVRQGGRCRAIGSGRTSRHFCRRRRCRSRRRRRLSVAGRQLGGWRLRGPHRGRARSGLVLARRQGPNLINARQGHAYDLALLVRGWSPLRRSAIFDAAFVQHVAQNNLVVADLLDSPSIAVEGTRGSRGRHDHLDFAVTARPKLRDLDHFQQRPRFTMEPERLRPATRSGCQEQADCQTEGG